MGTTKSSETVAEVAALRAMRTTTQADVDQATREHDADDFPAAERWSSVAHP
jgi:hypothetical protein